MEVKGDSNKVVVFFNAIHVFGQLVMLVGVDQVSTDHSTILFHCHARPVAKWPRSDEGWRLVERILIHFTSSAAQHAVHNNGDAELNHETRPRSPYLTVGTTHPWSCCVASC